MREKIRKREESSSEDTLSDWKDFPVIPINKL